MRDSRKSQAQLIAELLELRARLAPGSDRGDMGVCYQSALDSLGLAAVVIDVGGTITSCNRFLLDLTGWPVGEVLGRDWFDTFVPIDSRNTEREAFVDIVRGAAPIIHRESEIQTHVGERRLMRWGYSRTCDDAGLVTGVIGFGEDVTERKRAEEALRQSQEVLRAVLNSIPVRVFWKDENLVFLGCNAPFARDAGFERPEDIVGKDDYAMGWRQQAELYRADDRAVIERGEARLLFEEPQTTPSGERIDLLTSKVPLRDADGAIVGVLGTYYDITDRKRAKEEREALLELLRLINVNNDSHVLMSAATAFFQDLTGCEAVGVRLREGEDFPYFETRGFLAEFVHMENRLCAVDEHGELVRDSTGNTVLECMCGNILCGHFDPSKPFFTAHGSFWTNSTTELLGSTTEADRQSHTRNRCNSAGYESVALLPLRMGETTLGLLQLNDRRRERFTPEKIALLERFADQLAIGLAHRLAAAALRSKRDFANSLVETAQVAILVLDTAGRIVHFNSFMEALSGYRLEEVKGKDWFSTFLPHRDADATRTIFRNAINDIPTRGNVNPIIAKDGRGILVEWYDRTLKDADGKIVGLLAIGSDITDRKRGENALARRTQELETLADNAPDMIARLDRQFRYVFVNRRWSESTGLSAAQALGKTGRELGLPPERCDVWEDALARVFQMQEMQEVALEYAGRNGRRYYQAKAVPEFAPDGSVETALTITRDVTEDRRLHEELDQVQKMEVVGQLAAGIAHDIGNVLMAIGGFAALARVELRGNDKAIQHLAQIEEAVQDGGAITRGLLTFSHKTPPERQPVELKGIVEGTTRLLRRILPAAIDVAVDVPHGPGTWVWGDRTQLQQVILNLAVNARDAMPDGGTLRIQVREEDGTRDAVDSPPGAGPHGLACLVISDSGSGIAPDVLTHMFEPFFTTKPTGKGTGLGLSIAEGVIEAHGGCIDVESEVGRGTTFTIRLPRIAPAETPDAGQAVPEGALGRGEMILVAEDNRQVSQVLTGGLRRMGYDVVQVMDAQAVLTQCAHWRDRLRLLVIDIDLPKGDGVEALRRVRRTSPTIPAIVITAKIEVDLEALSDEHTRVFRKPFGLPSFLHAAVGLLVAHPRREPVL